MAYYVGCCVCLRACVPQRGRACLGLFLMYKCDWLYCIYVLACVFARVTQRVASVFVCVRARTMRAPLLFASPRRCSRWNDAGHAPFDVCALACVHASWCQATVDDKTSCSFSAGSFLQLPTRAQASKHQLAHAPRVHLQMVTSLLFALFSSSFVSPHSICPASSGRKWLHSWPSNPPCVSTSVLTFHHECQLFSFCFLNNFFTLWLPSSPFLRTLHANFHRCATDVTSSHKLSPPFPRVTLVTSESTGRSCCTCTFYMKASDRHRERELLWIIFVFMTITFFLMFSGAGSGETPAGFLGRLSLIYVLLSCVWARPALCCHSTRIVLITATMFIFDKALWAILRPADEIFLTLPWHWLLDIIYYFFIILPKRSVVTFTSCFKSLHPSAVEYRKHKSLSQPSSFVGCLLSKGQRCRPQSGVWERQDSGARSTPKRKVRHKYCQLKQHRSR